MLKKIINKKGTEILQVIIVIAILGVSTIAIITAISTQMRSSTKTTVQVLNEGTAKIYTN